LLVPALGLQPAPGSQGALLISRAPDALRAEPLQPPPPALLVLVRSRDTLVVSAVEGAALGRYQGTQIGIDQAWIDLRDSPLPLVRVISEHGLSSRSQSLLGDAALQIALQHQGLRNSTVMLGLGDSLSELRTGQWIQLNPQAFQAPAVQLAVDLAGLLNSALLDWGGDDRLEIAAWTHLALPGALEPGNWQLDLRNRALAASRVELGPGDDRAAIRSELTLAGPVAPLWQLQSIALDRSQLHAGSGNDVLLLSAAAPGSPGLAMRHAEVHLGPGDDTLVVEGGIVASLLDLGPGRNSVELRGAVQNSSLHLSPGSASRVNLAEHDDDLQIVIAGGPSEPDQQTLQLWLHAGGGDDRLWLPQDSFSGRLELWGGEGRDLFLFPDLPAPVAGGGTVVLHDLQWQGESLGLTDALGWASDATALIPSDLAGLGQVRLLPIAPLEQLLAGMADVRAGQPDLPLMQLAIGTSAGGSELLRLDFAAGQASPIALLPALTHAGLANAAG
jgi:hypothetical protein